MVSQELNTDALSEMSCSVSAVGMRTLGVTCLEGIRRVYDGVTFRQKMLNTRVRISTKEGSLAEGGTLPTKTKANNWNPITYTAYLTRKPAFYFVFIHSHIDSA